MDELQKLLTEGLDFTLRSLLVFIAEAHANQRRTIDDVPEGDPAQGFDIVIDHPCVILETAEEAHNRCTDLVAQKLGHERVKLAGTKVVLIELFKHKADAGGIADRNLIVELFFKIYRIVQAGTFVRQPVGPDDPGRRHVVLRAGKGPAYLYDGTA